MRGPAQRTIITIALTLWAAGTAAAQCLDFGSDSRPDIVWQHPVTGALIVTHYDPVRGLQNTQSVPRTIPFGGALMAVDCFDRFDREADLVMQDPVTGRITIVRMSNATPIEEVLVVANSGFQVVAAADFDRNGSVDLVLQDLSYGIAWIQYMDGTLAIWTEQLSPPQNGPWRIVAAPDLDRNQHPDIVWQNHSTGEIRVSMMSGPTTELTNVSIAASSSLRVVATGDYTGDANADLLMQNPRSGEVSIVALRGRTIAGTTRITNPTRWRAMSLALGMNISTTGDAWPTAVTVPQQPPPIDLSSRPSAVVGNNLVKLMALHSSKCLAVARSDFSNGARLEQATCSDAPGQRFWLTKAGTIVSALGRVVEVGGGSMSDGAPVNMWTDAGGANQRWRFVFLGYNNYAVINSQSSKVLDVGFASKVDGAPIQQSAYVGGEHQQWVLLPAEGAPPAAASSGLFRVVAQHSGKCLDLPGKTLVMGTQLQQWDCNGTSAQTFWFVPQNGVHRIVTATGQVLDVSGASNADGAPVLQWEWNNGDNQRWLVLLLPGNLWGIMSKASGKVVDVSGVSLANGAPILQWTFVNGANQKWRLERVLP
jgi:hypothetical protein